MGEEGVEPDDIGRTHAGLGQDRAYVSKHCTACASNDAGVAPSGAMPSWPDRNSHRAPGGTNVAWL
jgi:hypothetical protein